MDDTRYVLLRRCPRPSLPAAHRRRPSASCAILDFLAGHPHDRFGLSELARRLGLSKPTCLGIVTSLTDAGYLVRDAARQDLPAGPVADLARPQGAGVDAGQPGGARGTAPPVGDVRHHRRAVRRHRRPHHAAGTGRRPPGARPGVEVGQSYPVRPAGRPDVRAVGRRGASATGWPRSRRSRCAPTPSGSTA